MVHGTSVKMLAWFGALARVMLVDGIRMGTDLERCEDSPASEAKQVGCNNCASKLNYHDNKTINIRINLPICLLTISSFLEV